MAEIGSAGSGTGGTITGCILPSVRDTRAKAGTSSAATSAAVSGRLPPRTAPAAHDGPLPPGSALRTSGGAVVHWTVLQHDGPNHLGLWFIGLSSNTMALITSGCGSLDCPPTRWP